jgi:hypothetical protein
MRSGEHSAIGKPKCAYRSWRDVAAASPRLQPMPGFEVPALIFDLATLCICACHGCMPHALGELECVQARIGYRNFAAVKLPGKRLTLTMGIVS